MRKFGVLTDKQKRLIGVLAGTFFVLAILSLFEPIYGKICSYNEYRDYTRCVTDNLLYVVVSYIGTFFNSISPFAAAAATGVMAYFSYTLWKTSDRQATLTRESIDEAKKSSERQLRAYVSITAIAIHPFTANSNIRATYKLVNHGQTPAHDIRIYGRIEIWPDPLPTGWDFGDPSSLPASSVSVLFPQMDRTSTATSATLFNQGVLQAAVGGKIPASTFALLFFIAMRSVLSGDPEYVFPLSLVPCSLSFSKEGRPLPIVNLHSKLLSNTTTPPDAFA